MVFFRLRSILIKKRGHEKKALLPPSQPGKLKLNITNITFFSRLIKTLALAVQRLMLSRLSLKLFQQFCFQDAFIAATLHVILTRHVITKL